jgi:hypothetical protein
MRCSIALSDVSAERACIRRLQLPPPPRWVHRAPFFNYSIPPGIQPGYMTVTSCAVNFGGVIAAKDRGVALLSPALEQLLRAASLFSSMFLSSLPAFPFELNTKFGVTGRSPHYFLASCLPPSSFRFQFLLSRKGCQFLLWLRDS